MKNLTLIILSFLAISCNAQNNNNPSSLPEVNVEGGKIQGTRKEGLQIFKGIPYAAPPVGDLRWRSPQPVLPWKGVLMTKEYGNDAPQASMPSPKQDEDCLYLNVWAPEKKGSTPYPVMVWIHGGGFINGSGRIDGEELAKKGVVVVSFNYRLGRFGSFAHPELLASNPKNEPQANFWLQDQVAALKWVKQNIAGFGGDPSQVTIFGVSAGGTSVNMLMTSPLSKGLFHRAIAQSGVGGFGPYRRLTTEHRGRMPLTDLGISYAKANLPANTKNVVAALRALPWKTVAKIGKEVHDREGFEGVVDGVSLLDDLDVMFKTGKQHRVPFISGANSFEGNLSLVIPWTTEPPRSNVAQYINQLAPLYNRSASDPEIWNDIYGDVFFRVSSLNLVQNMEKVQVPAYNYYFDYVRNRGPKSRGAGHGSEVPYVLGTVILPNKADKNTIEAMQGHWVQFAKTGNPNGPGLPQWTSYAAQNPSTLVYGQNNVSMVPKLDQAKFDILVKAVNEAFSGEITVPDAPSPSEEMLRSRVVMLFEATRKGDIAACISLCDPEAVAKVGKPAAEKFFSDLHKLMKISKIKTEDHRITSVEMMSNGNVATVSTQVRIGGVWQKPGKELWKGKNGNWFYVETKKD